MTHLFSYSASLGELHRSVSKVHPGVGWDKSWKRIKLVGRGVVFGPWNVRWQEYLKAPFMQPIADAMPQLYLKVQLPYVNTRYTAVQRLEILQAHYNFVRDTMSDKLLRRLLVGEPITLVRWGMTTGDLSLRLAPTHKYWQEGELELDLYHEGTKRVLAFIHFCVSGPSELSIGCLQGGKPVEDPSEISNRELFAAFKKEMHGLRHKALLVFAARRMAQAWGLKGVRAVSAENQLWSDKLQADYNSFWVEECGVLAPDGMFDLPLAPECKERKSKRSMYARRDKSLDAIGREIEQSLAEPWRSLHTIDISCRCDKDKAEPAAPCDGMVGIRTPAERCEPTS